MKHPGTRPSLVVFQGGTLNDVSPVERLVVEAWFAATLDLLSNAATSQAFEKAILLVEDARLAASMSAAAADLRSEMEIHVEQQHGETFHFGDALSGICKAYGLERVVYAGGGALPMAAPADLRDLSMSVSGSGACVTANNLYSADIIAFQPASALDLITLPSADNDLAWLLHYKAGLPFAPVPRTLSANFDIDTPTDLATLWCACKSGALSTRVGPRLSRALSRVPEEMPHQARNVERAYTVMSTRRAEVLLAGRVSSWVWRRLEANLPCQTRIFSEERGMRASGREERGEARSLLGLYSELAGTGGLFRALEQVCNAALVDTRVLFAHHGLKPNRADRFASDALLPEQVADPYLRELTLEAVSASIPVLLGGHSLISGGAWALSERVRSSASAS